MKAAVMYGAGDVRASPIPGQPTNMIESCVGTGCGRNHLCLEAQNT